MTALRIAALCLLAYSTLRCATEVPPAACVLDRQTSHALDSLLRRESWSTVDPEVAGTVWPSEITWGGRANDVTPCAGTATFSSLGSVTDNKCECCDVLAFNDVPGDDACRQELSSVTLWRVVPRHEEALTIATEFMRLIGNKAPAMQEDGATFEMEIAPKLFQVGTVTIRRMPAGWRVHMMVYRLREPAV